MIIKPLVPFDKATAPPIELTVQLDRQSSSLKILYEVSNIDCLQLEPPLTTSASPQRQWNLWEKTCFEFFIAVPGQLGYWEVNLSPAGQWNVFRLDDYRSGIHEEAAIEVLPVEVHRSEFTSEFTLETTLDLQLLGVGSSEVEISVTAVIVDRSGKTSYWALSHAGAEADFHLRDSLIVKI